jgi:hypothetical protein
VYKAEVVNISGNANSSEITVNVISTLPKIVYTSPNVFIKGTIATISPTNTGSDVATYKVSPSLSLSTGLNFNTVTGKISGTPTTVMPSTSYTVTATTLMIMTLLFFR